MAKTKGEARTNNKEKTPAKVEEDSGLRSRRKRLEPKPRKRSALGSSKRLGSRLSKRSAPEPSKTPGSGLSKRLRVGSESEIANFQGIGKEQLKSATTSPIFLVTGFQAITAETIEYSKKSLENGSAFVEKLLGAKSFQSAIHVRSEYAKTSYAELVAYLTKLGELNTKLAKEAFKRRSHVA